ncbi:MAG: glycerophosphodiester phosphodiesterase [Nitrospinae bacterium]|nr:glycerophosphodiester phosphodiesterase [Nitrospinota bacterium]
MKIDNSRFVAHRGYAAKYPENTLLSMTKAVEAGAMFLECDIQLTADHVPLVHHDADLNRTTGADGTVMEMNFDELSLLSFGEPARFYEMFYSVGATTLADLVKLLQENPEVSLFVEIKEESLKKFGTELVVQKVFQTVRPVIDRCIAISFATAPLREAVKLGWKRTGWVLEKWGDEQRRVAEELSPEYLFCDHLDVPPARENLWEGRWKWVLYEIADVKLAQKWFDLGLDMAETMDIGKMLGGMKA